MVSTCSSILMYLRTARSTTVQVLSRGLTSSSSKVPASAGQRPGGGSYCGATETPGSGSRPTVYQRVNITASVSSGKNRMGLLSTNQPNLVSADGGWITPCGM